MRKLWVLAGLAVLAFGAIAAASQFAGQDGGVGGWRSPAAQRRYEAAYDEAMATLPAPDLARDVPTRFGTVRVYGFNLASRAAPVLLLPGRNAGAPMWRDAVAALAAQRPVYALDMLGDSGRSRQTAALRDAADQAAWLDEVLGGLKLARVHLVGHSFGGWLAANYAARYPARLASLSLVEPVYVFADIDWQVILLSVPMALPGLPESWRERAQQLFLERVGGKADPTANTDPLARMVTAAGDGYGLAQPLPKRITDDQLRALAMPLFVALGGRSGVHDGRALAAKAQALLPRATVRLWPEATHSLPLEAPAEVNAALAAFLDAADRDRPSGA